ncbi:unnamed protein product [Peniophora sp. CBMAI 1063]|nr:unnamed protein product [Peniophora sp. CBMAI 1063]
MSDARSPLPPVFGPRSADTTAAAKEIRLRIDLKKCTGISPPQIPLESITSRHPESYYVYFEYISGDNIKHTRSRAVPIHIRCLSHAAEWEETLYIECLELGSISIYLFGDDTATHLCSTCVSVREILTSSEVLLHSEGDMKMDTMCTLFVSVSCVSDGVADEMLKLRRGSYAARKSKSRHDGLNAAIPSAEVSWEALFRRLLPLVQIMYRFKIGNNDAYFLHRWIYRASQFLQLLGTAVTPFVQQQAIVSCGHDYGCHPANAICADRT